MSKNIISVKNLVKVFKVRKKKNFFKGLLHPEYLKVRAIDDISFEIKKGESVAFLGPNGAGKTTTTKMLTGLIYPTEGEISVLGYTPFDRKKEFLSQIGLVMGNKAGLNWDLTPSQSFQFLRHIYRIDKKDFVERIEFLTELLDTERLLDTQVRKLSLGERMKMELIGAILHYPKVLLLDEPTIGLDIIAKQKIREFLRDIQKKANITILLTSHDMDDVEKVCDRVIVVNKGKKVYDDDLSELNAKYQRFKYLKFIFKSNVETEELGGLLDGIEFDIGLKKKSIVVMKIKSEDLPKVIATVSKSYDLDDIDILSTPLEEIIKGIFEAKVV